MSLADYTINGQRLIDAMKWHGKYLPSDGVTVFNKTPKQNMKTQMRIVTVTERSVLKVLGSTFGWPTECATTIDCRYDSESHEMLYDIKMMQDVVSLGQEPVVEEGTNSAEAHKREATIAIPASDVEAAAKSLERELSK